MILAVLSIVSFLLFPSAIAGVPLTLIRIEGPDPEHPGCCIKDSFVIAGLWSYPLGTEVTLLPDDKVQIGQDIHDEIIVYPRSQQ